MKPHLIALSVAALSLAGDASAMTEGELKSVLERRLSGDRTGACIAVAVVEQNVTTAYVCADPKAARPFDGRTAFEIGSVTKTMTAALLADLIIKGEVALSDPLTTLLPPGTKVPAYGREPITLAHVVTHTSGLPALPGRMQMVDQFNPYAAITEAQLLESLAVAKLASKPGTKFAYSNFAMMVLSYALAKRAGTDFETLLGARLLAPLAMNDSYIAKAPSGVHAAQGHMSNSKPTPAWDIPVDMAGVGGVRATLPDMVRYAQALLRPGDNAVGRAIALTQKDVINVPGARTGVSWFFAPASGAATLMHEGGTGGFAALIIVDPQAGRALVALSDTAFSDIGGLGMIGEHLMDPKKRLGEPRRIAVPDDALLDALVGRYVLDGGLGIVLRRKGSTLTAQADGQIEFAMGYDSAGDFYALDFDAVIRPVRKANGSYSFTLHQGGGVTKAERVDASKSPATAIRLSPDELKAYEGEYPLTANFVLRVFAKDGRLYGQATGQGAFEITPVAKDVFVAEPLGVEITFEHDGAGKVVGLTLKQGGQVLKGARR